VFENRVLRRIFGPRKDEVTVDWRGLHNEELCDLFSPNVVRVIKSRRMRRVRHVAGMGGEVHTGFWWGDLRERDDFRQYSVIMTFRLGSFFANCIRPNSAHTRKFCLLLRRKRQEVPPRHCYLSAERHRSYLQNNEFYWTPQWEI
jgi:hypothetical protein